MKKNSFLIFSTLMMHVCVLLVQINRILHTEDFYSTWGILSQQSQHKSARMAIAIYPHWWSDLYAYQIFLSLLIIGFCILNVVRPRIWINSLLLFLIISQCQRFPIFNTGGGKALYFLMFFFVWTRFLLRGSEESRKLFQFLIGLQLSLIYIFAGLLKTGASWANGTALRRALSYDFMARGHAIEMAKSPVFDQLAPFLVRFGEVGLGVAVFLSLFLPWLGVPVFLLIVFFHLALELFFHSFPIPWVFISAGLIVLSFQKIGWEYFRGQKRRILVFLACFLALVSVNTFFNLAEAKDSKFFRLFLGASPRWIFFAPDSPSVGGWIYLKAISRDKIDYLDPVTLESKGSDLQVPKDFYNEVIQTRTWQKFFTYLIKNKAPYLKKGYQLRFCHKKSPVESNTIYWLIFRKRSLVDDSEVDVPIMTWQCTKSER